jgi:ribosomal protein S4
VVFRAGFARTIYQARQLICDEQLVVEYYSR